MSDKTNLFIERAKNIHGDQLYDYSEVIYINAHSKVKIICKKHGPFYQISDSHLRGGGCAKCSGKNKTTEEFIIESKFFFGNRYDYTKVIYKNAISKVIIICKDHGEFLITPNNHVNCKQGCKLCGFKTIKIKKTYTTQEFIDRSKLIHKNAKYDYTQTIYINCNINVKIICEEHGEFLISPNNHIHKIRGCPKCVFKKQYSKSSINWLNFISKLYNITIQHGENIGEYRIPNTKFSADGFCEETNTIYEFHGDYWHGNPKIFIHTEINKITKCTFGELYQRTLDKEQQIKDLGYNLITIWENDWKKLNRCVKILQRKYRNSKL